jgi:hypothetical protein
MAFAILIYGFGRNDIQQLSVDNVAYGAIGDINVKFAENRLSINIRNRIKEVRRKNVLTTRIKRAHADETACYWSGIQVRVNTRQKAGYFMPKEATYLPESWTFLKA